MDRLGPFLDTYGVSFSERIRTARVVTVKPTQLVLIVVAEWATAEREREHLRDVMTCLNVYQAPEGKIT